MRIESIAEEQEKILRQKLKPIAYFEIIMREQLYELNEIETFIEKRSEEIRKDLTNMKI